MSESRFSTGINDHGLPVNPAQQAVNAYGALLRERTNEAEPFASVREMRLKRVAQVRDEHTGALRYVLVDIERPIAFTPSAQPQKSGKFRRLVERGAEALDDFFSGGLWWREARDDHVWEAAREFCEDYAKAIDQADRRDGINDRLSPDERRDAPVRSATVLSRILWPLNQTINLALVRRAGGVSIAEADLPTA